MYIPCLWEPGPRRGYYKPTGTPGGLVHLNHHSRDIIQARRTLCHVHAVRERQPASQPASQAGRQAGRQRARERACMLKTVCLTYLREDAATAIRRCQGVRRQTCPRPRTSDWLRRHRCRPARPHVHAYVMYVQCILEYVLVSWQVTTY